MSTAEWYYLQNGQQIGPVASGQLRQLASRGRLQPQDLVWRDGLTSWVPAARVKGLFPEDEYTLLEEEAAPLPPRASAGAEDDEFEPAVKRPRKVARHGYAGFWKRAAAFLVDTIILGLIGFGLGMILGFTMAAAMGPKLDLNQVGLVGNILGLILNWLYFTVQESSESQATFGKRALHIKVVDEDGRRISFLRANGRYFGKMISALLLGIGLLMVAFTPRKQGLHDMMARTLVVND